MQVSLNWLNELVDLKDINVEQIAHELTMSGLEVEEIEELRPKFTNIITAKIEKIENHPNSDRLHLVTVNTGKELKRDLRKFFGTIHFCYHGSICVL